MQLKMDIECHYMEKTYSFTTFNGHQARSSQFGYLLMRKLKVVSVKLHNSRFTIHPRHTKMYHEVK